MLMIILQNAYGVEDGYVPSFDRESFANCHTGRRLRRAIPEELEHIIINASPKIGKNADSCFVPDSNYVTNWIDKINPDKILVCGKIAQKAIGEIENISIPILTMPHPAYRALKNETLDSVKKALEINDGKSDNEKP